MLRDPWDWTREDLDGLIGQAESMRLDFKESLLFEPRDKEGHQEHVTRIMKNLVTEVSAFANTEGGTIVVGIKEEQVGKSRTRIAARIDQGVDIGTWKPEWLQQLIESNLSPHLVGLRVRAVPLTEDRTRVAYVICVPQGSTAYQAKDYIYYGRSEFETRALPDHEIRLRMFRGKVPRAAIRLVARERKPPPFEPSVHPEGSAQAENTAIMGGSEHTGEVHSRTDYTFDVVLENTGEINISEFKISIVGSARLSRLHNWSRTYKDGWPEPGIGLYDPGKPRLQMHINVYPRDTYTITAGEFSLYDGERLADVNLTMDWTIYLKDTLPIYGKIDIANEFSRQLTEGSDISRE